MGGVNQQGGVEEAVLLSFLIACGCPPPLLPQTEGAEGGGAGQGAWGSGGLASKLGDTSSQKSEHDP